MFERTQAEQNAQPRVKASVAFVDRFIPKGTNTDSNERTRTRIFVALALICLMVMVSVMLILEITRDPGADRGAEFIATSFLASMIAPLLMLRLTGRRVLAATVLLVGVYFNLMFTTAFLGGPASPTFAAMIAVPVFAGLFAGQLHGVVWSVIVLASWVAFVAAEAQGVVFPNVLPEALMVKTRTFTLIPTGATIMAIVLMYESMNRALRDALHRDRAMFEHLASHDPLTELPNRRSFLDRLEVSIGQALRRKEMLALLMIDLNDFKPINDSLGHQAGDVVLRSIASRLADGLRNSDSVARIGGDEFAVIVPDAKKPEDIYLVAQKVIELVQYPIVIQGEPVQVTASVGGAIYPAHADSSIALMHQADRAMYRAKQSGRGVEFCEEV